MAAGNVSKRLRIGSDETEHECQKCSHIIHESISCSGCKLSYCLKCAKISETLYNCIKSGEMDQFMWSCASCKATFPSLENITTVLTDLRKSNDDRLDELDNRIKIIEDGNQEDIKESVESMKDDVLQSLKDDINNLVDTRVKELDERKRRDCNVVIFNMPEPRKNSVEENKVADGENLKLLSQNLGLEGVQIITLFRLGRPISGKCRPIKVVLNNKAQRKYLLDNAKFIKTKAPDYLKQVIITRDLTPNQRQKRRNRFTNKGVNLQTNETRNVDRVNHGQSQPTAMQVDTALSPIHPVGHLMSSTHLSQVNQYTDSQQTKIFNAYDEETLVDRTVIGGIRQGNYPQEPTSPNMHDNDR